MDLHTLLPADTATVLLCSFGFHSCTRHTTHEITLLRHTKQHRTGHAK